MPNHIKNKITLHGSIQEVENFSKRFSTVIPAKVNFSYDGKVICIKESDGDVGWLNLSSGLFSQRDKKDVLGLPEGFKISVEQEITHFPDFNKIIPQPDNIFNGSLGKKEREMCIEENRPNWYDWNTKNWGTKWNSYANQKLSWNEYTWETAWRNVLNIVIKLSESFDGEIIYEYSDEDQGANCGIVSIRNGKILTQITPDNYSNDAYEISFGLRPESEKYYKLVDGSYRFVDDEEYEKLSLE